ncbi:MAG: dockerin type I domain-containing protein [Oscillospiraceae bacterium]|nr:dockerin type I domain-containing protein [Oscillospiraceae bacterium]
MDIRNTSCRNLHQGGYRSQSVSSGVSCGCPCAPLPPLPPSPASLAFIKLDATSGAPLPGATFTLTGPGITPQTAVSDTRGKVRLSGLAPGLYQLRETAAPAGYLPNTRTYSVLVNEGGSISVDGMPAEQFSLADMRAGIPISDAPVIDPITAGAATVTGTGGPGCSVTVIFPNGGQAAALVQPDGTWGVTVPMGFTLAPNDTVTAYQQCPGASVSGPATATVAPTPPGGVRTVVGQVSPIAWNSLGFGPAFLAQFDATAELRTDVNTPAPPARTATVVPIGDTGVGQFIIPDVPFGNYVLYIKRPGYLARTLAVTVDPGDPNPKTVQPPDGPIFTLLSGDVNDDREINTLDSAILAAHFFTLYPSASYIPEADLNADGEIGLIDRSILYANFFATSSIYPGAVL